ncbi:hypothetical protein [Halorhabdus sp. CBA1104]|uniref:hypothetical protein n=1 Tax=Halorhabdus sp. CBA1104 TaxID=1380432 RepID=UPI0018A6AFCD
MPDADDMTAFEATVVDVLKDHDDSHHGIDFEPADFDMCPCGETHVDRTAENGPIERTNRLSKGADVERIEFELCEV